MKGTLKRALCVLLLVSLAFATTAGPSLPTAATGSTTAFGGTINWTNPTNIEATDGAFATCAVTAFALSKDLRGTGFGFSIPSTATINGIQLDIKAKASLAGELTDTDTFLVLSGATRGSDKATNTLTATLTVFTYGGPSDLWGTTWTPAQVNDSTFGATNNYFSGSTGATASVDSYAITVSYTTASGNRMFQVFRNH